jgi:hypothetical protein
MNPLQRMNIEEWIGALRGGSYRQTSHALHRGDSFCALGVLADIQGVDWEETRKEYSEPRGLSTGSGPTATSRRRSSGTGPSP